MSSATSPAEFAAAFAAIFNRRDLEAIAASYTEDTVTDLGQGQVFRGRDTIRAPLTHFLGAGLPITPRGHAEIGDTGVAIFNWTITGTAVDGSAVKLGGTAVDVLLREGGVWRQRIDLPFGGTPTA